MHVEALILAEGGSLQLRPLTDHLPVCLVPVGGTPILDQGIQALRSVGLDHITVLGGYRAAQVEQACRIYDVVRFRMNPVYTREDPVLQALCSVGPLAGGRLLVVRGDLVFDAALIKELLAAPDGNQVVVGSDGKPIGMWRLSPKAAESLFSAAGRVGERQGPEPDLYSVLSAVVETLGFEAFPANGYAWARVSTMEDLARALAAHRCAREATVARRQDLIKIAPAGDPRKGSRPAAPTNGVPTNGVPTNGASTNGVPTNGASTNGVPTNGASTRTRRAPWPASRPSHVIKPVHP